MTLQELRYVIALADHRHFLRAAEACHVGQPTLSMQIRKLEGYLGVALFDRTRQLVRPTPIGLRIIEEARRAVTAAENIRQLARQGPAPMVGELHLGVIPTLGPYLVPRLVTRLRASFPDLRISCHENIAPDLVDGLRRRRLDTLLLSLPLAEDDLEVRPLFSEAFVAALPAGHRMRDRAQLAIADIAGDNLLLMEEGHCMREQVWGACRAFASAPPNSPAASSLEMLRQMVAVGLGYTLLPRLASGVEATPPGNASILIRPLPPPVPTRRIAMVWRRACPLTPMLTRLGEHIAHNLPAEVSVLADPDAGGQDADADPAGGTAPGRDPVGGC